MRAPLPCLNRQRTAIHCGRSRGRAAFFFLQFALWDSERKGMPCSPPPSGRSPGPRIRQMGIPNPHKCRSGGTASPTTQWGGRCKTTLHANKLQRNISLSVQGQLPIMQQSLAGARGRHAVPVICHSQGCRRGPRCTHVLRTSTPNKEKNYATTPTDKRSTGARKGELGGEGNKYGDTQLDTANAKK